MRKIFGLAVLIVITTATLTSAEAQPLPPGDYPSRCRDIQLNGQFLSATCGGVRGGGQSSINVLSCPGGNISVDATGSLVCASVAGLRPPPLQGPGPGYPGSRPPPGIWSPPGRGDAVTIYAKKNFQGRAMRIDRSVDNLDNLGLNDHVRSIRLERRSGPWIVCADANFRGRCTRIDDDVADTRRIGMDRMISSLRPARVY